MTKLRLMTYNLGWLQGEGSEGVNYYPKSLLHFKSSISAVSQIIKENKIDITGVQEIDFFSRKSHYLNQFELIKNKTKLDGQKVVCWDQAFLPFPYHRPWGRVNSGGAFFTTQIMHPVESVLFDAPKDMFFLKRYFYLKRYIQISKVFINDKDEYVFNLHLEAFDFKAKLEQLIELKRLIKKYKPLAVLGDFNTLPEGSPAKVDIDYSNDPSIDLLPAIMNEYQDVFGSTLTFPVGNENCRLDYIWVKKDIPVKVIPLKISFNPSDHQPLALELEIK